MPVYKESLNGVIIPTISSLLAAARHYEELGGTASIYVNDDGMQLLHPRVQNARRAFYELNNIGWCARPPHSPWKDENNFIRKGHFKKASNMNYCLDFSSRVESEIQLTIDGTCAERGCSQEDLASEEESVIYDQAFSKVKGNDNGKTWAGGNVLIGDIILLVDSDTRVPEDCLLYAAVELFESPEVAILQHSSRPFQVVNNVFENGMSFFTQMIYLAIEFAVSNGDCAPFVGHNAFIRWKVLQSISWEEDGRQKFWSEDHVSEDFDLSIRLSMSGFIIRLATYHVGGFQEGVSITVYDELARWEKYMYGCNQLIFNPVWLWPFRGPFSWLILRFIFSPYKVTSKISILAYLGTFYAIASAFPLAVINYFIVGWYEVDGFYISSWKILIGILVVFNLLAPFCFAMTRHRQGDAVFIFALVEGFKWTPMFLLFFAGTSFHLFKASVCHFLLVNMEWTSTAKELASPDFRVGLDRIFRDFKSMYCILFGFTGLMIFLASYAPGGWMITDFRAIFPLAYQIGGHALLPFALGLF